MNFISMHAALVRQVREAESRNLQLRFLKSEVRRASEALAVAHACKASEAELASLRRAQQHTISELIKLSS